MWQILINVLASHDPESIRDFHAVHDKSLKVIRDTAMKASSSSTSSSADNLSIELSMKMKFEEFSCRCLEDLSKFLREIEATIEDQQHFTPSLQQTTPLQQTMSLQQTTTQISNSSSSSCRTFLRFYENPAQFTRRRNQFLRLITFCDVFC